MSVVHSGLLLSNAAFIFALIALYWYVQQLQFSIYVARATIIFLCFSPQSVVFSSLYAESFVLFFASIAMLMQRQEKFWLSGLSAAVLSGIRPNGVLFVIFAIARLMRTETLATLTRPWRKPEVFLPVALAPLGLIIYWWFCFVMTGDAFAQKTTAMHGWGWGAEFPWKALWQHITKPQIESRFWAITSIGMFICSLSLLKYRLYEEFAFSLGCFILFFSGIMPNSLLRYSVSVFPIYIGLARLVEGRPQLFALLLSIFCSLNSFTAVAWSLSKPIAI